MKLTDGERLIVVMLAELMKAQKLGNEIDPSLILTLASSGDDWAIKHKYSGLFGGEPPSSAEVSETIDILWMWGIVEHSVRQLGGDEAKAVESWRPAEFSGFDGNNDRHYHIASTLINELGEFQEFKDRNLNSHSQTSLPRYREMYKKFEQYVRNGNASPLPFASLQNMLS